jgi:hypothetical protein
MGKIGILTFHEAINYGAVMQAYALKTAIGESAEIIPYRSQHIYNGYHLIRRFKRANLKEKIAFILSDNVGAYIKKRKFQQFVQEHLGVNKALSSSEVANYVNSYDVVVTGSDQVFNPDCTGEDYIYFLDIPEIKSKRVSYAASFGSNLIRKEYHEKIKDCLNNFDDISVREIAGQEIVKKIANREAKLVLDPTLLIDREYWEKLAVSPATKQPFVFVYAIEPDLALMKFAKEVAGTARKVIYVGPGMRHFPKGIKRIESCGPQEWLGFIKNADFVVTNAFHGIALSLAMMKQVYIGYPPYAGMSANDRIKNIVSIFQLENQIYTQCDMRNKIDYNSVNSKMNLIRTESLDFIKNCIINKSS